METFLGDEDAAGAAGYDSGFDLEDGYGTGGGGGIIPSDGISSSPADYTDKGYGLCANDSMDNLTYKSLFCDYNYTNPMIPINVSG